MIRALKQAKKVKNDIPVGCVIEKDGEVISCAFNKKEVLNDVLAHAEILAIKKAQKKLNNWRLDNCTMYVTLEPCPMCAWAILQSRISVVKFGSFNKKYGALGSVIDLNQYSDFKTKVYGGIFEDECDKILEEFFEGIRKNDN